MAESKAASFGTLVSDTLQNTAAHGIPNMTRAKSLTRRCIWAFLFVFGLTMFVIQSVTLVQNYILFEVNVNLDVSYVKQIEFPAVTICNMNPIKKTALAEVHGLLGMLMRTNSDADSNNKTVDRGKNSTTTQPPIDSSNSSQNMYQAWENGSVNYTEDQNQMYFQIFELIADLPYDERKGTGHTLGDMLLSCSFDGHPCEPRNFTHIYNYRFGNCYTFHSALSNYTLKSVIAGQLHGLTLELFIEQDQYIPEIEQSAGLRVSVHARNVMPFPEDNGVSISPGQDTSIGVRKTQIGRRSYPYSNCTTGEEVGTIFKAKFPFLNYSIESCQKSCQYEIIKKECKCSDYRYRYNDNAPNVCITGDHVQDDCISNLAHAFQIGELICSECEVACNETLYQVTVSSAVWPNTLYRSNVADAVMMASERLEELYTADQDSFIESNILKVNVFFNMLEYKYIYHTPAYEWYDLASDLGGQVGLWIGVSVLTLFEFVELVFDIIALVFARMTKTGMRNKKINDKITPKFEPTMEMKS